MEKISVLVCVYNESSRIERFLDSFTNFDEVIVLDKSSTDDTVKKAKKYPNVTVIEFEYSDQGDLYKYCAEKARNEWLLFVTASDVIHPNLLHKLNEIINHTDADVFYVPYIIHCLGICSPYSAFDYPYRQCLAKKSVCVFNDRVHQELSFNTTKIEKLPKNRIEAIHHLTHQNIDSSFERLIRYSKEELKKGTTAKEQFRELKGLIKGIIRHRFWKLGWDGVALAFLAILYRLITFLRVWAEDKKDIEEKYDDFANTLLELETKC